MQITRLGTDRASSEVVSGILNCVCPECGGRMGGVGREFKCQGECQTDWRPVWEQSASSAPTSQQPELFRPVFHRNDTISCPNTNATLPEE
jgi:hypothetical protein